MLTHSFAATQKFINSVRRPPHYLQIQFLHSMCRRFSAKTSADNALMKPIHNASYLIIFTSINYSGQWYKASAGSIMERSAFPVSIAHGFQIPKTKGTTFKTKRQISPDIWKQIFDGLGVQPKHLVLDFNPELGLLFFLSFLSLI